MDDNEQDNRGHRRRRFILLFLLLKKKKQRANTFRNRLNDEGRRRRNRGLPRGVLCNPNEAPWHKLYIAGDDGALITVTGFDHDTFDFLHDLFLPYFIGFTPWVKNNDGLSYKKLDGKEKRGRKRMVSSIACLGLTLSWYRFRGAKFILQGWFGFTGTVTNCWLRFGRRMLIKALLSNEEARVCFPDDDKIAFYKEAIKARHTSLQDVYCVADGLKLPFESCASLTEQSMFYNGWQHGHYITNLFVFGADRKIINAVINVPGLIHDSTIAIWGGAYDKLKDVYNRTGGICCVDSAFASGNVPYLIKSAQDTSYAKSARDMVQMKEATSLRQAAEWGMRAIQGSMPRLKDNLAYEENGERKRILKLVPLLYNIRLARVGLNQIANTYVPAWSKDADYFITNDE